MGKTVCQGIVIPLITPFDLAGEVDEDENLRPRSVPPGFGLEGGRMNDRELRSVSGKLFVVGARDEEVVGQQ